MRRWRPHRATLAACGSGAAPPPRLHVRAAGRLLDAPVRITVSGLRPGERVRLSARTTDEDGAQWRSSATFAADRRGVVDPSRQAPLSGSYRGVDEMGLFWSMLPIRYRGQPVWYFPPNDQVERVTIAASGRRLAARATVDRLWQHAAQLARTLRPPGDRFYADLFMPTIAGRRPAVLLFGGSEGGLATWPLAELIASHGYPALALAYFEEPGLPATLDRVPLEEFVRALRFLRRLPGVDPRRVAVLGISRGSEAALLLGAHEQRLVDGVIALAPSNVVHCSYPGCIGSSWTLHGRPLPFSDRGGIQPSDPRAVIPVERIHGPILLACGGADRLGPACPSARAIVQRLAARRSPYRRQLLAFPDGGHGIATPIPNEAASETRDSDGAILGGRTRAANAHRRVRVFAAVRAFLRRLPAGPWPPAPPGCSIVKLSCGAARSG